MRLIFLATTFEHWVLVGSLDVVGLGLVQIDDVDDMEDLGLAKRVFRKQFFKSV